MSERQSAHRGGKVIPILMPQAGNTMEEGTVISWRVKEGDQIAVGQMICEIETDKATMDFESPDAGRLARIVAPDRRTGGREGIDRTLGRQRCGCGCLSWPVKESPTASAKSLRPRPQRPHAANGASRIDRRHLRRSHGRRPSESIAGGAQAGRRTRRRACRRRRRQRSRWTDSVDRSGGRRLAPAAIAAAGNRRGEIRRPLSKMRRAIGLNLQQSKQTVPHFYVRTTIDADPLLAFYREQKTAANCTLNDVIVLAVGRAIREFPAVRSQIVGNEIVEYPHANIGIAVGIDDGLVVPVVLDVDTLSLAPAGGRNEARRRAGPQGPAGKHRQRSFHDQQPRHVRRRRIQRDHQSAGIGNSGRECRPRGRDRRKRCDASRPPDDDDAQRRPSNRRRRDGGEVHAAAASNPRDIPAKNWPDMADHFQLLVIGAGPGGYVAALKAAQLGARVAVVEKHHLGGTCLNYGCIPSKALLSSAEMLHSVRHADKWGVKVGGDVGFDWNAITAHKDKTIRQLRGGIASLLKGRAVTQLAGKARFEGPGRVVVTAADGSEQLVTADKVIVATGSAPMRIPGWPDDPAIVCTSDEAVHWTDLPKKLLIVGGGVIGCEFACMMQSFGVDGDDRRADAANSADARRRSRRRTAESLQAARHRLSSRHEGRRDAYCRRRPSPRGCRPANRWTFDRVLVATGRRPNTGDVGLDRAGIRIDRRGFVEVNDRLETNVAGHYTIGDANGRSMLAHAASAQGVAAAENALGHAKPFDAAIPSAVYTFPEVAAVGMTEQEARDAGLPIAIGRFPIGHLGKAMAARHQEGFVKIDPPPRDERVARRTPDRPQCDGVHRRGHGLDSAKGVDADVAETVWAHPTISEAIKEAAEDALGVGLHLPPRKVMRIAAAMA